MTGNKNYIPWGLVCFLLGLCGSKRLVVAVFVLFGVMLMYSFRVTMSVAIVCMTTVENEHLKNDSSQGNGSSFNLTKDEYSNLTPDFDWDKTTQGVILGSFFWAYFTTPVLGGWLALRVGGRRLFGLSVLLCSICTLLVPVAADTHVIFLITVRVLCGLAQGAMWPAQQMVWAKWAPPLERTLLSGFTVSGISLGNVVAFPVSGILCRYAPYSGWPFVFYVFGSAGVVWCVLWMVFVFDSPAEHPRISTEERTYIVTNIQNETNETSKPKRTPWKNIFTSAPVWSIAVIITCADWGFYTFLTNIPTYLNEIFSYNIVQGGLLSAMPFLGVYLVTLVAIPSADQLRNKEIMTTTKVRKLFNTLGTFLPAVLLFITSQVSDSPRLAVSMLTLGISSAGFLFGAVSSCNSLDIAARYSGIIMGIATSVSAISGIVAPTIIGVLTKDKTPEQWQIVFYIVSTIYLFGCVFYLVFGSGELQEWAKEDNGVREANTEANISIDDNIEHLKSLDESSNVISNSKF